MSQRVGRLEDLLRQELSHVIRHEVRDPRVALATVSSITVSRDLSHAKVRISVLGDDEEQRQETVEALDRAKGFLRSSLARRTRLRTVPALEIELDRGFEHSQRISALLDTLDVPPESEDDVDPIEHGGEPRG